MTHFALASYIDNGKSSAAIELDGQLYALTDVYSVVQPDITKHPEWVSDITLAIGQWQTVEGQLQNTATRAEALVQAGRIYAIPAETQLLAPFQPTTIFGTASNYHEHAAEMNTILAAKPDSSPYVFIKATTSVIGTGANVILPPETEKLDWEVELGVVIGKSARRVKQADALDYIAGYTVVNDISARDLNRRSDYPFKHDWFRGKSWDTFCPMGPVFVPKSCIEDTHNVKLSLHLNGKQMQDGNTSELIWNVFEQIEYLSSILTLRPGDLIMTGTPAGVGKGIGLFLKDGDVLESGAAGIGTIRNTVKAEQI